MALQTGARMNSFFFQQQQALAASTAKSVLILQQMLGNQPLASTTMPLDQQAGQTLLSSRTDEGALSYPCFTLTRVNRSIHVSCVASIQLKGRAAHIRS